MLIPNVTISPSCSPSGAKLHLRTDSSTAIATITTNHHCKPSLQTITANHHCKPSLQTITANHHCKPSLQTTTAYHHCNPSGPNPILHQSLESLPLGSSIFLSDSSLWRSHRLTLSQNGLDQHEFIQLLAHRN
jgi:hypothetical protein